MQLPDATLERAIAGKFEEIADIGWFPQDLHSGDIQFETVKNIVAPSQEKRILDAGCARGRFVKGLVPTGARLYGVDLTETFVHSARTNVPGVSFTCASLSALPFDSETFDAVYCVEVLEHLPDTELALREMTRVLRPGGTLLVIDKSLQGLNPSNGLPNFLAKAWAERQGALRMHPSGRWIGWMYPRDFAFRERWFWPAGLARQMRRHCRSVQVRFITEGYGRKVSGFYQLLPFLSYQVAWIGRK